MISETNYGVPLLIIFIFLVLVEWKFYLSTTYIQKERLNVLNTIQNLSNERELLDTQKDELKAKFSNLQSEQQRAESI